MTIRRMAKRLGIVPHLYAQPLCDFGNHTYVDYVLIVEYLRTKGYGIK